MLDRMNTPEKSVVSGAERHPVPFYGSYASFLRAMKALKEQGIPKRVNSRSLRPLLGDEGPRLSTHFVSMGWVDQHDKPTEELAVLVRSFGEDSWKETLSAVVHRIYGFVPEPWADLTSEQLHEAFTSYAGRGAQVMTQAETFFLSLVLECGMQLPDRLYFRAERAHREAVKRGKLEIEEPEDTAAIVGTVAMGIAAPLKVPRPELKQIDLILKLSTLLGDSALTDQERKAIGITISVLARTNAA
jgi:hypothetical protein